MRHIIFFFLLALLSCASTHAQSPFFKQTLDVSIAEPVILDVAVSRGDITIGYARDGEVSIYASAKDLAGKNLTEDFFKTGLLIEQYKNHISIRDSLAIAADATAGISYRIDVPFQTQINSSVSGVGNQKLIGVAGPAKLTSGIGNIDATYVRFAAVEAITGKGNISCSRAAQVRAETGAGNITLMEDGPSKAAVKKGPGRIEVGGARGSFEGTTDVGELHIKAVPNDNWHLTSIAGNIRVEVPSKAKFRLDASTLGGNIYVEHDAMQKPPDDVRKLQQEVNGGGKSIQARSNNGNIFIQ
jgi:DUF4097 and DUF4098 domain-containing protein YvlB